MLDWFNLKDVRLTENKGKTSIHIYLDENENTPDERTDLRESMLNPHAFAGDPNVTTSTYDMGEVTKTRRTMIMPNQAIATYVTQWTYDSHNRLLGMIYPDEEKITYSYNLGGQLEKVHGYKSYSYDYVSKIGYALTKA